jgi:hypothetical integral membrane protein (TIGR02206 family)
MEIASGAEQFSSFGASHQVAVAFVVAGALVLARVGRARRGTRTAALVGRLLAVALVVLTLPVHLLHLVLGDGSLQRTLPLDLCDLAWIVAVIGLWTRRRWAVTLTYYWGLTLTTQAIITPDLAEDLPDPAFLVFWATHAMVVWAAVYLTWGLGMTPDWRSYRLAVVTTAAWAVTAFLVNVVAGTNFGYLSAKPASASILDLLGDWPLYLLTESSIVVLVWALVTWPWVALQVRHDRRRALISDPHQ